MAGDTPIVQIKQVSKNFGSVYAVDDISLDIYRGEFFLFSVLPAAGNHFAPDSRRF